MKEQTDEKIEESYEYLREWAKTNGFSKEIAEKAIQVLQLK